MRQVVVVNAIVVQIGLALLKVLVGARRINWKGDQRRLASRKARQCRFLISLNGLVSFKRKFAVTFRRK